MFAIKNVSKETLKTYQIWATPIVKSMKKSKILTKIIAPY
jgi:hypothetical protein